ncbi:MAG: sulfate permease [Deltaproteobacteria bacterium]|nr:MAG: sulfate permease [Deltaproteobacteria bacterium]RLC24407.1 MAG: sulfate permease [Deltaproteobacteria bacterium]
MTTQYRFNRQEFAGSLGDLGTILPIAIGMILVNGLNPSGLFLSVGLFYILTGIYYGVTVSVQPMKVIGAYAIATAMSSGQVLAAGLLMGMVLLVLGLTGAIDIIGKYTPKSVTRGVQLSTGTLLMAQGVKLMIGTSKLQLFHKMTEPYLSVQSLGPIPIGIFIGIAGALLTLFLLDNKKMPAGLVVVILGLFIGLILGTKEGFDKISFGFYLPQWLPLGFPVKTDFTFALFALVLPQLPMTVGNAVIANADLSKEYFGEKSKKVTYRGLSITMALGCILSFFLGGMPLCHGAGGLAAHYRFGARTAGSNFMIGILFVLLVLSLGSGILAVIYLIPMAILGVLLIFAGSQLALTIQDIFHRKDLFVVVVILGITLATNLGFGVMAGFGLAYLLKSEKVKI